MEQIKSNKSLFSHLIGYIFGGAIIVGGIWGLYTIAIIIINGSWEPLWLSVPVRVFAGAALGIVVGALVGGVVGIVMCSYGLWKNKERIEFDVEAS